MLCHPPPLLQASPHVSEPPPALPAVPLPLPLVDRARGVHQHPLTLGGGGHTGGPSGRQPGAIYQLQGRERGTPFNGASI